MHRAAFPLRVPGLSLTTCFAAVGGISGKSMDKNELPGGGTRQLGEVLHPNLR